MDTPTNDVVSTPQPSHCMDAQISRQLLGLHRALSLDDFWKSLRRVVECALPSHSLSVYLNYFDIGRSFSAYHAQNAPGSPQPWDERRRFSPTPEFLRGHVGRKMFELGDLIPDRRSLPDNDYFRHVMQVEGWLSMSCLTYWREQELDMMVVLRRTRDQGHIAGADREFVETLYDHIDTALARIRQIHDDHTRRACMERCLPFYPLGLIVLDPQLKPVSRNQEALEACIWWNHGVGAVGRLDPVKAFALPAAVVEACRELAQQWSELMNHHNRIALPSALSIEVRHPADRRCRISVNLVRPRELCLARPFYLVQLVNPSSKQPSTLDLSGEGVLRLQALTPREREVALGVIQGRSNLEIALHLGKSETTVKSQLVSIFQKLGIQRRAQLVSMLK